MINLEFVCDLESAAGYAAHARMIVKALDQYGIESRGIALKVTSRRKEPSVVIFTDEERATYEKYLDRNIGKIDVRVFFEPAHFLRTDPEVKTVSFVQWETTRIKDYATKGEETNWVNQLNSVDLVMTSSTSAAQAFRDSGVKKPIVVNSGPIFPPNTSAGELHVSGLVMNQKSGSYSDVRTRPIVIGYMAQWTPRKNVEAFIRDITIAFNGNASVVGLLKTYSGSMFNDEENVIKAARVVRDSCKVTTPPNIFLVTEKLTDVAVEQFFNTIDIYYCPSRGEGYNVPAAMAAAAGIPVIAGSYGGHADFLRGPLLPGSFSPCLGMSTYDSNQFWFNVDEREAISTLRYLAQLRWDAKHNKGTAFEQWDKKSLDTSAYAFNVAGAEVFVNRFENAIKELCAQATVG